MTSRELARLLVTFGWEPVWTRREHLPAALPATGIAAADQPSLFSEGGRS